MKEQRVGEVISRRRQELGISQEELAEGLCETVTVSRLENGKQTPSRDLVNALLQRLDLPGVRFYAILTRKEERLDALRGEIISLSVRFQSALEPERNQLHQKSIEKLAELEKIITPRDRISHQFLLRTQALLGQADGTPYPFQERLELLLEAIRLTVPRFTLERLSTFRYSLDDIKVLSQIAHSFSANGQREKALDIYNQLFQYVNKHYKGEYQVAGPLCLITHNYAIALRLCERYGDALKIAELGLNACIHYGHYEFLGGLTHTIAECYHFLDEDQKSLSCFCQAFHLYNLVGNKKGVKLLQADASTYFGNLQAFISFLGGVFG